MTTEHSDIDGNDLFNRVFELLPESQIILHRLSLFVLIKYCWNRIIHPDGFSIQQLNFEMEILSKLTFS